MDLFGNWMSLAHRKSPKTLEKMDFKLRNRHKPQCVQYFETPCIYHLELVTNPLNSETFNAHHPEYTKCWDPGFQYPDEGFRK